jgi:ribosomal protein L11
MSEKKIYVTAEIRINGIPAGNATPAGALGPALGQKKIQAAKFCKEFNDLTADHKGKMCNIKIKLY